MIITQKQDVRTEILDYIKERGISQTRLGCLLEITATYMHNILMCRYPLTKERLQLINEFLGTDFKEQEPCPTPPEQI